MMKLETHRTLQGTNRKPAGPKAERRQMTKQPRIKAEVDYDHQHGPLVRVTVDGVDVAVYLADETGIVTKPNGQYGLKVSGPWHEFRQGVKLVALDATVDDVET